MSVPVPSQISLWELLSVQGQPVTEEQAWALCYHGCQAIQQQQHQASNWTDWLMNWGQPQFRTIEDLILNEDGTVGCVSTGHGNVGAKVLADDKKNTCTEEKYPEDSKKKSRELNVLKNKACTKLKVIESLGVLIYKALDWSLPDDEERVLSLPLEQLIEQMVVRSEDQPAVTIDEIMKKCKNHLQDSSTVSDFQAVNKALFAETVELRRYWNSIRSARKSLKRLLEEDVFEKASPESACWSRVWFQLMKEVRSGVRLRSASERSYTPVLVEPEGSSFKRMLDDIKYKRYILRHVTFNNNEPRTPCKALLDLGLLRSLLKPVTERKLRDKPTSRPCLHEMLMREIRWGVKKLKPVSSDEESQSMDSLGSSVQTGIGLQCEDVHTEHQVRGWHQQKPEFMDLESEADRSGLEQNSGREGQSPAVDHNHADTSTEKVSTKPSSYLDVTNLVKHSINKYKFQYPLQIGQPLGLGYEFVENEEYHYSSSLCIKELACVCQTIAKREVRTHKMVRAKLCLFCQREFFFTWALTCHFCKKINLFRVLYEDVNPFPCMHLPIIYKPLAARTVDVGVQAERYRCECEKVQQWDSNWKPKVEKQETTHVVEHR